MNKRYSNIIKAAVKHEPEILQRIADGAEIKREIGSMFWRHDGELCMLEAESLLKKGLVREWVKTEEIDGLLHAFAVLELVGGAK